jgi:hypothetical protein
MTGFLNSDLRMSYDVLSLNYLLEKCQMFL